MELPIPQIPPDFATALPKGLRVVKRSLHDFLLVEELFCPAGHSLIVQSVKVHDEASIKLQVKIGGETGSLFIDSFWGSHAKLFSFIPKISGENLYVEAFCPYCQMSLGEQCPCEHPECDSKRGLVLALPGGVNRIHVCARLGCPGHRLEITDLSGGIVNRVNSINFFGAGADEIFGGI